MSSYLPRSDADRFWAAVTAATIAALVWLIVAVGPESAVAPHALRTAIAAHIDERKPVAAHMASDRAPSRTRAAQRAARASVAKS
jgi:hypothetical protein